MIISRFALILCIFLVAPLTVLAEQDKAIVAKVGGVPITVYELQRQINTVLPLRVNFHGGVSAEKQAEIRSEALNDLIERGLKVKYAIDNEISVSSSRVDERVAKVKSRFKSEEKFAAAVEAETVKGFRAAIYRQFLADKAEEVAVNSKVVAKEEEIKKYYQENKRRFFMPRQFRASHILIKVDPASNQEERAEFKKKAEDLLARAKEGEDFFNLAYYNSDDRTKYVGGDLGMFHEGQTEKPFEDALKQLEVGEISDLVQTRYGYHIIKLTQINEPRQLSYDEMATKIKTQLEKERRDTLYAQWIDKLRAQYKVERFVD